MCSEKLGKKAEKIVSFNDLLVYQNTYEASIEVMKKIVPKLPDVEKHDLKDQLRRACKAIPRLIAEGYGKRHQKRGFQKYLADALGECNEMIVSLSHAKDIYGERVDVELCKKLINIYNISGKQIYRLSESWSKFKDKGIRTT